MLPVLCVNGPNLNRLGSRQPEIYGKATLADLEAQVVHWGEELGFEVTFVQSNREGDLVEAIHSAHGWAGVVINPAALGHYSFALRDAITSVDVPVVEVHLSNVRQRARWRHRTVITSVASANIFGRGIEGYRAALRHLAVDRRHPAQTHRYGSHPDQVIDVRGDAGAPGVVLFHGGFWMDTWGRDTTESWAADLADHGIRSTNVEYRRLDSGGGRRSSITDAVRGLDAAIRLLATDRVVVIGHSAGVHLALHALDQRADGISLVVGVGGVLDLVAAVDTGLGNGAVAAFDPDGRTTPLDLPPPSVPVRLVHGEGDTVVPVAQSRTYAEHFSAADVEVAVIEGEGHFQALSARSRTWEAARSLVLEGLGLP